MVSTSMLLRSTPLGAGPLARSIRKNHLTYLSYLRLASLRQAAEEVRRVPGVVIECGVALGGSGILLASLLRDRPYHGYDTFEEFPPPGPDDPAKAHRHYAQLASGKAKGLGGNTYHGYLPDLVDRVAQSFTDYGVTANLHKGLFDDSLKPEWPIALAHIDADWYESVRLCFERITPRLSPGARLVIDDYADYGGAKKATDEYLAAHPDVTVLRRSGHLVLGYHPAGI